MGFSILESGINVCVHTFCFFLCDFPILSFLDFPAASFVSKDAESWNLSFNWSSSLSCPRSLMQRFCVVNHTDSTIGRNSLTSDIEWLSVWVACCTVVVLANCEFVVALHLCRQVPPSPLLFGVSDLCSIKTYQYRMRLMDSLLIN